MPLVAILYFTTLWCYREQKFYFSLYTAYIFVTANYKIYCIA